MDIIKFNEFINEAILLPILDAVIDNGVLYNGRDGNPLIKGSITRKNGEDFFTPSSAGFLFESFLAGLIPDARINDDNTEADLKSGKIRHITFSPSCFFRIFHHPFKSGFSHLIFTLI